MRTVLEFLAVNGGMLALGVTLILAMACALVVAKREPIHRQRIAEGTMVLCVIFLVLGSVPLPRFELEKKKAEKIVTVASYVPQAGDEVIAAEVFKVPQRAVRPGNSTGIPGVPG